MQRISIYKIKETLFEIRIKKNKKSTLFLTNNYIAISSLVAQKYTLIDIENAIRQTERARNKQ